MTLENVLRGQRLERLLGKEDAGPRQVPLVLIERSLCRPVESFPG
jgi:hypothetical protein